MKAALIHNSKHLKLILYFFFYPLNDPSATILSRSPSTFDIILDTLSSVAATMNKSLSYGSKHPLEAGASDTLLSISAHNFVIFSFFFPALELSNAISLIKHFGCLAIATLVDIFKSERKQNSSNTPSRISREVEINKLFKSSRLFTNKSSRMLSFSWKMIRWRKVSTEASASSRES